MFDLANCDWKPNTPPLFGEDRALCLPFNVFPLPFGFHLPVVLEIDCFYVLLSKGLFGFSLGWPCQRGRAKILAWISAAHALPNFWREVRTRRLKKAWACQIVGSNPNKTKQLVNANYLAWLPTAPNQTGPNSL
jgi:hypothetical protein